MSKKRRNTSLGESDFRNIREKDLYFVDKTDLIRVVHEGYQVLLLTRPRRFGKTLALSMLRYFYGNNIAYRALFDGLSVSQDTQLMALQGQNPVVWLSFKKVKAETWADALYLLCDCLVESMAEHGYLGEHPVYAVPYQEAMTALKSRHPDPVRCATILKRLIEWLHGYHNAKVVVLVDEYDTPVTTGWLSDYYQEMLDFLKQLLGDALKDNIFLEKSVLSGVLRVSKESFFSDFNNFGAYSVVGQDGFSDKIGFTPDEVKQILQDHDMNGPQWDEIEKWYDGYRFGATTIFNPWSILNYVHHPFYGFQPYWVNTSDNRLLMDLFFQSSARVQDTLESLVRGEKIRVPINPHFTYGTLKSSDEAVWNMLLFAGYLKCENPTKVEEETFYELSVPNSEVRYIYKRIINAWLQEKLEAHQALDLMLEYLLKGELKHFERFLRDFVLRVVSYHDTASPYTENFYHAFLLGLFVRLDGTYQVRSNREAGLGRYDIALIPKDNSKRGFVFEIKTPDPTLKETLVIALNKAKKQLKLRKYATAFKDAGIIDVSLIALAVQGKELLMKTINN